MATTASELAAAAKLLRTAKLGPSRPVRVAGDAAAARIAYLCDAGLLEATFTGGELAALEILVQNPICRLCHAFVAHDQPRATCDSGRVMHARCYQQRLDDRR